MSESLAKRCVFCFKLDQVIVTVNAKEDQVNVFALVPQ